MAAWSIHRNSGRDELDGSLVRWFFSCVCERDEERRGEMGSSSAAAKTLGRPVMAVTAATTARERAVVNVVAVAKVNFSTQTRVVVQRRFPEERCRFHSVFCWIKYWIRTW